MPRAARNLSDLKDREMINIDFVLFDKNIYESKLSTRFYQINHTSYISCNPPS